MNGEGSEDWSDLGAEAGATEVQGVGEIIPSTETTFSVSVCP